MTANGWDDWGATWFRQEPCERAAGEAGEAADVETEHLATDGEGTIGCCTYGTEEFSEAAGAELAPGDPEYVDARIEYTQGWGLANQARVARGVFPAVVPHHMGLSRARGHRQRE